MNEIPLDELLKKADSRYSLVIAASKRARELINLEFQSENDQVYDYTISAVLEDIIEGALEIIPK
ncbi:MAG: DNA-directed RNA polymerase subunit omega [Desulfotomaculum sp.]|nr:DNA-directed RNA polymerase subunit omega [Desulfotomaculum sp.]